jgi:hypothetical protein
MALDHRNFVACATPRASHGEYATSLGNIKWRSREAASRRCGAAPGEACRVTIHTRPGPPVSIALGWRCTDNSLGERLRYLSLTAAR